MPQLPESRISELARLFGRLGATAFGGPAAHISMMHDEVVIRRGWLDNQEFLDLIGVTNLIPGPNSTEMAMQVGHQRAGWRGLLIAGLSFIAPAALIVLLFAWVYVEYGDTPSGEALLYGVKPVVLVIVAQAIVRLSRTAIRSWVTGAVGVAAAAAYVLGGHELVILAGGALLVVGARWSGALGTFMLAPLLAVGGVATDLTMGRMFLVFLKAGAFLYGSGYVLLAFLHSDLVEGLGVLTDQQLLDAVAVGHITPGPVLATATFIGYVLGGVPGAAVATVAIFLPAFLFVAAVTPMVRRIRETPWAGAALDGVNVAAVGLMVGVSLQIGRDAFVDPLTVAIGAATALVLWRTSLNSAWLLLGGAGIGIISTLT